MILFIVLVLICLLNLFISYKKTNYSVLNIIIKLLLTIVMILISYLGHLKLNYCAIVVLLTSIMCMNTFKDENEEYFFPIKASLSLYASLKLVNLSVFNNSLIIFVINIFILLLYLGSNNRWVKNINLLILLITNILIYINIEYNFVSHILSLLMIFIDYYLIYINEAVTNKKIITLLDILYVILLFVNITHIILALSTYLILISVVLYTFMIILTRKDKVVLITSLLGYLLSTMYYFIYTIDNNTVIYILSLIMTFICFILFDKAILKNHH